jgi:hypothetical protein
LTELANLKSKVETGKILTIFLYGRFEGKYNLRAIESDETHWNRGRPAVMKISLICKEYIESIPLKVAEKLQAIRDTNPTGPERLPGMPVSEVAQSRPLTPKIDDDWMYHG